MLTDTEMLEKVETLWSSMTDLDWEISFICIRKPKSYDRYSVELGCMVRSGENDGYYLYKDKIKPSGFIYVLSYSERGYVHIIIKSENFEEVEYKIAYNMAEHINYLLLKQKKYKKKCEEEYNYNGIIDFHMRYKMLRGLLKRTTPEIFQKSIEEEMNQTLKNLWSHATEKPFRLKKSLDGNEPYINEFIISDKYIDKSLDGNSQYLKEIYEREIKQFNFIHIRNSVDDVYEGYYLYNKYINKNEFVFIFSSFKERVEEIIISSKDIEDIEYEMAWKVTDYLNSLLRKNNSL